jgi:hypothetical protein
VRLKHNFFFFNYNKHPTTFVFSSPTPKLREINGAERLVPKALFAEEELLLLWIYRTALICNSFESLFR